MSLKSQLEKKDEYILGLERQVNELTVTAEVTLYELIKANA